MANGRQQRSELLLPLVLTTGSNGAGTRYVLDVDEDGNLIVEDKNGTTLLRIQTSGDVDAHQTFNDFGV